jgi:hypothetical protein
VDGRAEGLQFVRYDVHVHFVVVQKGRDQDVIVEAAGIVMKCLPTTVVINARPGSYAAAGGANARRRS